ncbi:PQQ-binding-like beta-propeller repeat protein [Streptosporangium roseum]|uniref:outer membrane protein assembly factor BamB family protein n=1 Tax=Streptosporangium roseum TaxID=2001 RepID=UPI003329C246
MTFLAGDGTAAIGPFRIVRLLGEGGMGQVYLATSASGRSVAVKVVRPELAGDPSFRRRFKAEVEAARAVSGAFTTPVVDADPDGPVPWLATVYVPGPSLQSEIETHGPMPEAQVRILGARLAEALDAIHRAGIIHRDLKPSNILLADDGPRVIDFGISRAADGTSLTATGGVIGSAGYMSPEQIAGRELTSVSDVFALGAVVAFASTGRSAFGTGPFQAVMFRAAYEPPQLDGMPPGLVGLVSACLDKDPLRRPAVTRLPGLFVTPGPNTSPETVVSPETIVSVPAPTEILPPSPQRRQLIISGAVAAVVAVAGASAALLATSGRDRPTRGATATGSPSGSTGAQPLWTRTVSGEKGSLATLGDLIFCLDKEGTDAFTLKDGKPRWKSETNYAGYYPKLVGKRIYMLGDNDSISAFDPRTGEELWISGLSDGEPEWTFPSGSTLVVRDTRDRLHGLDAATGKQRWTFTPEGRPLFLEGEAARGVVLATPKYFDAYAAISITDGELSWSRRGRLHAQCTDGKRFYVLGPGLNLAALDPLTGREIWSRPSRMPPYSSRTGQPSYELFLAGDTLVCRCSGPERVAVFDVATGRRRWPAKSITGLIWARSDRTFIYVDSEIKACDLLTGEALWTGEAADSSLRFRGGTEDLLIGATTEGLHGWDVKSGRRSWNFPHPTDNAFDWGVLRTPGRLFAKHRENLFAFDFPGAKAPIIN